MNQDIAVLSLETYNIYIGDFKTNLKNFLQEKNYTKLFVIVDDNTERDCLPILLEYLNSFTTFQTIKISAGEIHKNIDTCLSIWQQMMNLGAERKSLTINLGGGVIGDMGGFCASTFKRGMDFIQMPTTLLSQVDASIGGKLGVDFMQVKNSIGVFNNPKAVFIDPLFLKTLSKREIRSGFAEIIKHSLIADKEQWLQQKTIDNLDVVEWKELLVPSLKIKKQTVEQDPFEKGWRKALNFGHTIGHAVEGVFLETDQPLLHGEAIAIGMICESYLSYQQVGLTKNELEIISQFLLKIYGRVHLPEIQFQEMIQLMKKDKKNENAQINFTLLESIGSASINHLSKESLIIESLKYYNDLKQ